MRAIVGRRRRCPCGRGRWALAVLLAGVSLCRPADAQQVTGREVAGAVRKGAAYLKRALSHRSAWGGYAGGVSALGALALLNAGVSADDPAVARAIALLERVANRRTYVVALKCQVYAAAGAKRYARELQAAATWLAQAQLATGMWTYARAGGRGDNSNTQFALLGLHAAANAGAKVPKVVWTRARRHFNNTQLNDGGWTYVFREPMRRRIGGRGASYGSMTAAGLASLYLCGQQLHVGGKKVFENGAYPGCGRYRQNVALAKGLEWLGRNFSVRENPNRGSRWHYYYLYALERVGMISGRRYLGVDDWYREGAAFLVRAQRPDGSWKHSASDTAFALLFLAKGNRPVLIQKLKWNGRWNRNRHDLENLLTFIGEKLGRPAAWQVTDLAEGLAELRAGPILFLTGHEFAQLTREQKVKLRAFVESGGTLLAEACCGSKAFAAGMRAFAREVFPEYRLGPLPADHPVFHSYYDIQDTYGLEGLDCGCRTGVFFSPRALSCLWELRTIPEWSQKAFRLGTNIAAYATGREALPDKLDAVKLLPAHRAASQPAEVPRGAVRIARLIHQGDYNSDPHCLVNLAAFLRDRANVDVVSRNRAFRPSDEKIYEYPVVFMHGHWAFQYSDKQIAALRRYLQAGGVLVADACCGRKAFDKSFREMVRRLFPKRPLTRLARDHPIYTGKMGVPLGELRYRRILAEQLKADGEVIWRGTTHPPVEAVTVDGRTVILYSKYDFSCGLEGDKPFSCRGYVDADAIRLAMNLFLYAISY